MTEEESLQDVDWDNVFQEASIQAITVPKVAFSSNSVPMAEIQTAARNFFGFDALRGSQGSVIEAVCNGKDVLVLWATGKGKSLCYQLPPLMQSKTAIVVSPLLSLMADQVTSINGKFSANKQMNELPPACFLGSSQTDHRVEADAVAGRYRLVYLTPEKLASSGFLARLAPLIAKNSVSLLAVDEAHCTSEWGHDFRPEFMKIGMFRTMYPSVPIIALTATAVDRVRHDIVNSLQLHEPVVSISSLDRTNLGISVMRKSTFEKDVKQIIDFMKQSKDSNNRIGSTIIYVASKNEAERLCKSVSEALLASSPTVVGFYHGGLDARQRNETHVAFLTGSMRVVVATIAFGMGIDKPDIRSIVHYGSPSSMEAYVQQIGRAGRDGLNSNCLMLFSDNDFASYNSDFYLENKTELSKVTAKESLALLQKYCNDLTSCRRKAILDFFHEVAPYDRCGTCDSCLRTKAHGGDLERDFTDETIVLLRALGTGSSAITTWFKVVMTALKGKTEDGILLDAISRIAAVKRKEVVFKELVPLLVSKGLILRETVTTKTASGYSSTYDQYKVSSAGLVTLSNKLRVILPVPNALRIAEAESGRRLSENLKVLADEGIDASSIPISEMTDGDGEMIGMLRRWNRYIFQKREAGQTQLVKELEETLAAVFRWRDLKAAEIKTAPASLLPDHVAKRLVYTRAKTEEDVRAAGVRFADLSDLVDALTSVRARYSASSPLATQDKYSAPALKLPNGLWKGARWTHAILKPAKNGALPVWKLSLNRFSGGESLQSIALNQPGAKASIQVATVVQHLLTALLFGEALDLQRLAALAEEADCGPPNLSEWEAFEARVEEIGIDIQGPSLMDYSTQKDVLRPIVGGTIVDLESKLRSQEDSRLLSAWINKYRWYVHLKVMGIPAVGSLDLEHSIKRQRV